MNPIVSKLLKLSGISSILNSKSNSKSSNKPTLLEHKHKNLPSALPDNNNYKLQPDSNNSSNKELLFEKEMAKAIENEDFEIYYQPQVNTEGIIYGAEALLRWNHHEWGSVSPGEFIPLAEETQLINPISDWVIKKVCSQLSNWKDKGLDVRPVSINLSPVRLMEDGLVEFVTQQLEMNNIPSTYLEFEITENTLLKIDESVLSTLEELKELGIKIAIDDFGTGYSSIEYLREVHADTLKIDQVFIKNMSTTNKKDVAIVSSILHLAKGLNMRVVAEGVEEYEQFHFLKQKECDYIQGYLFSKSVPADMYEKLLRIGYIKPVKYGVKLERERRKYFRFEFPFPVLGEMTIIEVNNRRVDVGATEILIKDISLGGLKVQSTLKLPINTDFKFRLKFFVMDEQFNIEGAVQWKDEAKGDTFLYGIAFNLTQMDDDRLAPIINKMSALRNSNQEIPGTEFIYDDSLFFG